MKSYINTLLDYREVSFEKEVAISCPEDHIRTQMRHLTRKFKKTEAVQTLEKGDVVVLALESTMEKFNRPGVYITVGGGLFHKEFEEALVGHTVGETFGATVDETPVKVTVKQASRTSFPEPDDEMAAAYAKEHEDYAECVTVEAYLNRVIRDYLQEKRNEILFGTMDHIMMEVLTRSDWEFDEEELETLVKEEKAFIREELKEEGKELEGLSADELKRSFGVESLEEMEQLMKNGAEQRIAAALWRAAVYGTDTKAASMEELEDLDWAFLETYVNENITIREEK